MVYRHHLEHEFGKYLAIGDDLSVRCQGRAVITLSIKSDEASLLALFRILPAWMWCAWNDARVGYPRLLNVITRLEISHFTFIFCNRCKVKFGIDTENIWLSRWWHQVWCNVQTCWFKAVWALPVPINTIGPHYPWSLLPMPDAPTPVPIAIKLASCLCHHHQCTGKTLCLLVRGQSARDIDRLLWYKCCLILTHILGILKI